MNVQRKQRYVEIRKPTSLNVSTTMVDTPAGVPTDTKKTSQTMLQKDARV